MMEPTRKKIFVTGATGFIGRYVTKELVARGYKVIGLTRRGGEVSGKNVEYLQADLDCPDIVSRLKEMGDNIFAVLHLAADIHIPGDRTTLMTNIMGTYNIMNAAQELEIQRGVFLSSVPVIGYPKKNPIDESHPVTPLTQYHMSKYTGEQMAEILNYKGASWITIRIPSPIGRGMKESFFSIILDKLLRNEPVEIFGLGTRQQSYVDVRDVARGMVDAMESSYVGLLLLSGTHPVSDLSLAYELKDMVNSCSHIVYNQRVNPDDGVCWNVSHQKAHDVMGYRPRYNIEDTVKWMTAKKEE